MHKVHFKQGKQHWYADDGIATLQSLTLKPNTMTLATLTLRISCSVFFLIGMSPLAAETVLERVSNGGKLIVAHRESSIPFSYLDGNQHPVGYALDLCLKIAEAVRKKTGAKNMPVEYLMVTPANRISSVEQGKADLECGSTTNNLERRQKALSNEV
jgi:ABC-type amino acid transport substrate-binding protein